MVTLFATGRIGKVDVRQTQSGKTVTRFSVCTDLPTKDTQGNYESEWTNFTAWDKTAEIVAKFGSGDIVEVQASKKTTKRDDKFYTDFTVQRISRLLKSKKNSESSAPAATAATPAAPTYEEDDDIPF